MAISRLGRTSKPQNRNRFTKEVATGWSSEALCITIPQKFYSILFYWYCFYPMEWESFLALFNEQTSLDSWKRPTSPGHSCAPPPRPPRGPSGRWATHTSRRSRFRSLLGGSLGRLVNKKKSHLVLRYVEGQKGLMFLFSSLCHFLWMCGCFCFQPAFSLLAFETKATQRCQSVVKRRVMLFSKQRKKYSTAFHGYWTSQNST